MSKEISKDVNQHRYVRPLVDVNEDDNGIYLHADMPGVKRENFKVEATDNKLTISGTISTEVSDDFSDIKSEFRYTEYRREFTLSRELDTSKITANLNNGVLYLNIPKREEVKPRKIEIISD
ncbi:Hsp20/alpha crystallin family protein [Photobacterium sp. J15]|uniref:Hsp20/alpha crystallin family protein n=1 Tax=Photobacterium sp. J15 TaxID=265901 RepID=UPI0007E43E37|nr:Hsp20/alpha crystallin family protein [Photobacterium sp. J15]